MLSGCRHRSFPNLLGVLEANDNSKKIPLEIRSKCVQVYALFWGEQQASAAIVALACNFFGVRNTPLAGLSSELLLEISLAKAPQCRDKRRG